MKRVIKSVVGVTPFWELTGLFRRGGCAVLTYHRIGANREGFKHVSADVFRRQMRWLREHCTMVSADEFQHACARVDRVRPAVLVTFDDGYRDYHDEAYPILRELKIPAVNFIATAFADLPDRLFWWDVVDLAIWSSTRRQLEIFWRTGEPIVLDDASRHWARMDVRRYMWSRPTDEREATLDRWCDALGVRRADLRVGRQVMTWDEIRAVGELTTIGGHTHTHGLVSRMTEPQLREELATCRDRITAEVSRPTTFAYPSGEVTDLAKEVLAQTGFHTAFSGARGINDAAADWLAIKRINAPGEAHQLPFVLSGISARFAA